MNARDFVLAGEVFEKILDIDQKRFEWLDSLKLYTCPACGGKSLVALRCVECEAKADEEESRIERLLEGQRERRYERD